MKRSDVGKRPLSGRGRARAGNVREAKEDNLLNTILSEARLRLPDGWTSLVLQAAQLIKINGGSLMNHEDLQDPGFFLELMWRARMRYALPGNQAMYQQAKTMRGFNEYGKLPQIFPEDLRNKIASGEKYTLMDRQGRQVMRKDVDPEEAAAADAFGQELSDNDKNNMALRHLHVITNVRPHGFSSVGQVSADSDLGKILLHGLQLFMEVTWNNEFAKQLHDRHKDAALIDPPSVHQQRLGLCYCEVNDNRAAVPPAATQVPVFDHLSVASQMMFVSQVVEGIILMNTTAAAAAGQKDTFCSLQPRPLPPDNVFCWAAFNKLLGLGMMAAVEEAAAAAAPDSSSSSSSGGVTLAAAAAAADLQELAAAREAESAAATSLMAAAVSKLRVSLHDMIQQQQQLGAAAMQLLAAVTPCIGSSDESPEQQQQVVQQMQQQSDLAALIAGSSSSTQQQQQQIWLQSCIATAWPLLLIPSLERLHSGEVELSLSRMPPAAAAVAAAERNAANQHHGVLPAQLIAAAAQSSSSSNNACNADVAAAAAAAAADGDQSLEQLLLLRLSELLLLTHENASTAAADNAAVSPSSSSNGSNAAASTLPGLELQAFVNLACHLLLQRLLQNAPATSSNTVWTQNNMLQLLHVILAFEKAKSCVTSAALAADVLNCCTCQQQQHQQQQQQQTHIRDCAAPAGCIDCESTDAAELTQQQQQQDEQQEQHYAIAVINLAVQHLCIALAKLRNLRYSLDAAAAADQPQQQQTSPSPAAAAAVHDTTTTTTTTTATTTTWRSSVSTLYKSVRPSGWTWLERNFNNAAADNAQPGFWGLVRCFASADLLNLHRQAAPSTTAAASSMWTDVTLKDPDYTELAMFSKQAARTADKALALFLAKQSEVCGIGAPVCTRTLVQVLRLACLAGAAAAAAAPPLPYADLESSATGSSSSSKSRTSSTAAAAAAAARWQGPALHLGEFNSLGPMFCEQQQGPCLARLMELIAEYYQQHAQAAEQAAAGLQQKPQAAASSSGGSGGNRLFILLLGLYHVNMLERQQLANGAAAAGRPAVSVYSSLQNRLDACSDAVAAAKEVMDIFIWCSMSPGSSSSSSGQQGDQMASKLMHDYLRLIQIAACDLGQVQNQQQQLEEGGSSCHNRKATTSAAQSAQCNMYGCRARGAVPVTAGSYAHVDAGAVCDGCRRDFSCRSSEPEQDPLFVCSHCGAAIMCGACFNGGDVALMHLKKHCKVLQELFDQHCELLTGDLEPAELTDDQRHDGRTPAGSPSCRCETCCIVRDTYIQLTGQRFRYSPLQLLQVPWWVALHPQQQQQHSACIGDLAGRYGLQHAFINKEADMHAVLNEEWGNCVEELAAMSKGMETMRARASVLQRLDQFQQQHQQLQQRQQQAGSSSSFSSSRRLPDLKFSKRGAKQPSTAAAAAAAGGRFQHSSDLRAQQQQQQQQQQQEDSSSDDPSWDAFPNDAYNDLLKGLLDRGLTNIPKPHEHDDSAWSPSAAAGLGWQNTRLPTFNPYEQDPWWADPELNIDDLDEDLWRELETIEQSADSTTDEAVAAKAACIIQRIQHNANLRVLRSLEGLQAESQAESAASASTSQ